LDRKELQFLSTAVDFEGQDVDLAHAELRRWVEILAQAPTLPRGRDLAVRALRIRGVPESDARLAVESVIGDWTVVQVVDPWLSSPQGPELVLSSDISARSRDATKILEGLEVTLEVLAPGWNGEIRQGSEWDEEDVELPGWNYTLRVRADRPLSDEDRDSVMLKALHHLSDLANAGLAPYPDGTLLWSPSDRHVRLDFLGPCEILP